jgi:hypothetical protein
LGGIPPRPSEYKKRTAPPSCSLRAEPRTKVFFSFWKKKIGARKLKNVKKTFLRGGEVSERQWRDVLGILKIQAGNLDLGYLTRWAKELKVSELLESALAQSAL